jgi:hypothetical protein
MIFSFNCDEELVESLKKLYNDTSITIDWLKNLLDSNKITLKEYLSIVYNQKFINGNKNQTFTTTSTAS